MPGFNVFDDEATAQIQKMIRQRMREVRQVNEQNQTRWHKKGGKGGGKTINFQIVSSDPLTGIADVQIEQRAFTGSVEGSRLDDTVVTVYDVKGCSLNEPNVNLTGRFGVAALMISDQAFADKFFDGDLSSAPARYWDVQSICCRATLCVEPI